MQRSKRPRLSNEAPVEVLSSVAQSSPGHPAKFKLPADDAQQGRTLSSGGAGSEPGQQAFPRAKLRSLTAEAGVPGTLTSATEGQPVSARLTLQRPPDGTATSNQLPKLSAQRRVWVREELQQRGSVSATAPAAGSRSATQTGSFAWPKAGTPPSDLLAMQRRLQRQGRLVLHFPGSTSSPNPATVPRPLHPSAFPSSGAAATGTAAPPRPPPAPRMVTTSTAAVATVPNRTQVPNVQDQVQAEPGVPASRSTRRVWVRSADVQAPPLLPPVPIATDAMVRPGPSTSGGASLATAAAGTATDRKLAAAITKAIAPAPRFPASGSHSKLRSGNVAAGTGVGARCSSLPDDGGKPGVATTTANAGTTAGRVGETIPAAATAAVAAADAFPEALPGAKLGTRNEAKDLSIGARHPAGLHRQVTADGTSCDAAVAVRGPGTGNAVRAPACVTTLSAGTAAATAARLVQAASGAVPPDGAVARRPHSGTTPAGTPAALKQHVATQRAIAASVAVPAEAQAAGTGVRTATATDGRFPSAAAEVLVHRRAGTLPAGAAPVAVRVAATTKRLLNPRGPTVAGAAAPKRRLSMTRTAAATASAAALMVASLPPGSQYLRPDRHKLVRRRKAAALCGAVGQSTTIRTVMGPMVATAARVAASGLHCSLMAPPRAAAPSGGSGGGDGAAGGAIGPGNAATETGGGTASAGAVTNGRSSGGFRISSGKGGPTASASSSGAPREGLAATQVVAAAAAATMARAGSQQGGTRVTSQRTWLRVQRHAMASAAAAAGVSKAAGTAAAAARLRVAARVRAIVPPRRGQLIWRRRVSGVAGALGAAHAPGATSISREVGTVVPGGGGATVSASTSTISAASGATAPTSSVTSPPALSGGEVHQRRPYQCPILLRVGRSRLWPATTAPRPAAAAVAVLPTHSGSSVSASLGTASAGRAAAGGGAVAGGVGLAQRRLGTCNVWPAPRVRVPAPVLGCVRMLRQQQHQRRAFLGAAATGRAAGRSLKLLTVNGQQYYTAGHGGARGPGSGEGMRQLHSLSSIAGKAAAAAAAAVGARRAPPAAAARRVAMAFQAVRKAVWRRRGLDPTSPTAAAAAAAAAARRRILLGTSTRPATASMVAMPASTMAGGATRAAAAATASTRAGKVASSGASVRAAAAQRILAKARMRHAAAQATKARGYCPDYCRTGVCSLSRDPAGGRCPHTHDPTKVAVCARWLAGGCTVADCHLQHRRLPDLMPLCTYFLQGKCTAVECPYLHKTHATNAPVCRAFLHSYCPRGAACPALHLTARMARERARLLTASAAGGGGSGSGGSAAAPAVASPADGRVHKRRLSDGGSGAGTSAAATAGEPAALFFAGVALQAPKRRRGGFRYFDADVEEPGAAALTADGPRGTASLGNGGSGAARVVGPSGPAASSSSLPPGSERLQGSSTAGGDRGTAAAAGKVFGGDDDDIAEEGGAGSGPMLLPGGMMLYM